MQEQIKKVENFHNVFKQEMSDKPVVYPSGGPEIRFNLMKEENEEYMQACVSGDLVEIADALGDQLYILCGTILKHGMQHIIADVFAEIHESNMSKLDAEGNPILRGDGKIMKGPNYFKPNIGQFITED
jgi:predicted HAD superfamily Cof-like phosphohydrolase